MTPVGFEPTQLALVELESTPLDHSGKASCSLCLRRWSNVEAFASHPFSACRRKICISRESNPGHIDGNDVFYH